MLDVNTTNKYIEIDGLPTGRFFVFRDVTELRRLREELKGRYRFHNFVGKNHKMLELYDFIRQVADSPSTILIQAESGTGKELVAKAIHYNSPRANKPVIKANCSVLVESLLESELFGHVKGSFTGALYNKIGRFDEADGGTIFLDEIGELGPQVQLKLLGVIQDRIFSRVSENQTRKVDVRIISATNRDLKKLIIEGKFREDLYYRLKVIPLTIPPLCERKDDIAILAEYFLRRFSKQMNKKINGFSSKALLVLMEYHYPGNVRELENAVEHSVVLCRGEIIEPLDLPREVRENPGYHREINVQSYNNPDAEREALIQALNRFGGNRSKAAKSLNMGRTTLWRKMKEYGLSD